MFHPGQGTGTHSICCGHVPVQSLLWPTRPVHSPQVPRENCPRQFWCVTMLPTPLFQITAGRSMPSASKCSPPALES
ncbi:MAG TPA: hypothetical protein VE871_12940 [Longimicrobium sp.]|nr:hypothetical protein [Longimicrobium sp.]